MTNDERKELIEVASRIMAGKRSDTQWAIAAAKELIAAVGPADQVQPVMINGRECCPICRLPVTGPI